LSITSITELYYYWVRD